MSLLEIPVFKLSHAPDGLPEYATPGSAGMDIRAAIEEPLTLAPFERRLIPTGLIMHLPEGYECQVRPRSGLSIKHGITLINCVGTIDSDYRNELMVPLVNLSQESYTLQPLERIAQLVIAPVMQVTLTEAKETALVAGRSGGFGSTGKG
jgi:dUTP pyrophosphatase